jgi:hypothetical protein
MGSLIDLVCDIVPFPLGRSPCFYMTPLVLVSTHRGVLLVLCTGISVVVFWYLG